MNFYNDQFHNQEQNDNVSYHTKNTTVTNNQQFDLLNNEGHQYVEESTDNQLDYDKTTHNAQIQVDDIHQEGVEEEEEEKINDNNQNEVHLVQDIQQARVSYKSDENQLKIDNQLFNVICEQPFTFHNDLQHGCINDTQKKLAMIIQFVDDGIDDDVDHKGDSDGEDDQNNSVSYLFVSKYDEQEKNIEINISKCLLIYSDSQNIKAVQYIYNYLFIIEDKKIYIVSEEEDELRQEQYDINCKVEKYQQGILFFLGKDGDNMIYYCLKRQQAYKYSKKTYSYNKIMEVIYNENDQLIGRSNADETFRFNGKIEEQDFINELLV